MKKITFAFVAFIFTITAFAQTTMQAPTQEVTSSSAETLRPDDFNQIVVDGNFTIYLSQGNECLLNIDAAHSALPVISAISKKGVLTIGFDKKMMKSLKVYPGKIDIYVTVVDLKKITLSGGCVVIGKSTINTKDLTIKATASTIKSMNIMAKSLTASLKETSRAEFMAQVSKISATLNSTSGASFTAQSVSKMTVSVKGASSLLVNGRVNECDLTISDASIVNGNVNASDLNATLKGSSSITIEGSAEEMEFNASGGSIINASKLFSNEADINLAGTSTATINSRKSLDACLKGACKLTFMERNEERSISSAGKFNFKF